MSLHKTNRTMPQRRAPRAGLKVIRTTTQRTSRSPALELYQRELAYYRADAPYLTLEKAAERCVKLSILLTQARMTALES